MHVQHAYQTSYSIASSSSSSDTFRQEDWTYHSSTQTYLKEIISVERRNTKRFQFGWIIELKMNLADWLLLYTTASAIPVCKPVDRGSRFNTVLYFTIDVWRFSRHEPLSASEPEGRARI